MKKLLLTAIFAIFLIVSCGDGDDKSSVPCDGIGCACTFEAKNNMGEWKTSCMNAGSESVCKTILSSSFPSSGYRNVEFHRGYTCNY